MPKTVSRYGSTKEEIFVCYEEIKDKYGADADRMPLGAIGGYSATEKIRVGLQQLMAGARKWRVDLIGRYDLASLTEECAKVTGIPYIGWKDASFGGLVYLDVASINATGKILVDNRLKRATTRW